MPYLYDTEEQQTLPVQVKKIAKVNKKTPTYNREIAGVGNYRDSGSVATGNKDINLDAELNGTAAHDKVKYPNYFPTWDASMKLPPLEDFEHDERGKYADPTFPNLIKEGVIIEDVTGTCGAEVSGVQLSQLSDAGKDELALFVAQKKVVAFRDQDFADMPVGDAVEFARYFGPLHIHPTSAAPAGHPEVHLVYRTAADKGAEKFFEDNVSSVSWHTDISYEKQPSGTTFLYNLETPKVGGDTIFSNMVEAYNRLSPMMQERLHGLQAVHVGSEQVALSKGSGGIVRREAVDSIHPLIRTHPATGEKAIFVNESFTRRIIGLKKTESDMILKFLYDHINFSQDLQARLKWKPGTVVMWDNRVTQHTAIVDWMNGERRHLARLTPLAEKPYETPYEG